MLDLVQNAARSRSCGGSIWFDISQSMCANVIFRECKKSAQEQGQHRLRWAGLHPTYYTGSIPPLCHSQGISVSTVSPPLTIVTKNGNYNPYMTSNISQLHKIRQKGADVFQHYPMHLESLILASKWLEEIWVLLMEQFWSYNVYREAWGYRIHII